MKLNVFNLLLLSPIFLFSQTKTEPAYSLEILFTIIIITVSYFSLKKLDPKFAINTKRVICPNCKTKQPIFRVPKTSSQLLWGGTTCPKCKTELDKLGNILEK